jgi:GDSL-like Lipase/Acylhydrolase family
MAQNRSFLGLKIVAVNLVLLFIGIVVLELFFGNWIRPNQINRLNLIRDANLTYSLNGLYPASDPVIHYSRDVHGFRSMKQVIWPVDILTLGGSTTDQRYISDGQTWQDVLSKKFSDAGKNVQVVNAGVDGQSTNGHIRDFDWWFPHVPNFGAKFICIYAGINDFFVVTNSEYDELAENSWKARIRSRSAVAHLYRLFKGTYQARHVAQVSHRARDFSKVNWTDKPLQSGHEKIIEEALTGYRDRLRILLQRAQVLESAPICMTQPKRAYKKVAGKIMGTAELSNYGQIPINGVDEYWMMKYFNQATLDVCRQFDGIPVDLAEEVEWEDTDFYDYFHNTPAGANKIGIYLFSRLESYF